MDPVTTLAVKGIAWVATQSAQGVAGNAADRHFTSAARAIRDRLPSLVGTPAGDDLARGLRRAQLRALERVILDFRETGFLAKLGSADAFTERALAFCRSSPPLRLRPVEADTPGGGLLALVPADAALSVTSGAAFVEDAVLAELRTAVDGTDLPARFVDHYRNGGSGRRGFLPLFGIYFAEQIKDDDAFREVLHTRLLLQTAANFAQLWTWLERVDERLDTLDRVESGVVELAAEQRAGFSELAAGQAAILEALAAQKGLPTAPLRAILERLGEAGVPDDQIPERLAAKADEYLALREQWSKVGEATPDVDAVRGQALELIDAGDLDGARQLFADARVALRAARERRARDEAAMLAGEAEIDRLELRYLAAADRYAEAEVLVAPFDADWWFWFLCERGIVLQQQGDEFADNGALEDVIEVWYQAARLRDRSQHPMGWATIQNNLGNALQTLGIRESTTERLEQAIEIYHAALQVQTRERAPSGWATLQNNLGSALLAIGKREAGPARVEEAVKAYHLALEERPRGHMPLEWAMTQNNLANALSILGERQNDTTVLKEAVQSYRAVLEHLARERVPLAWAMTMNNLGGTLASVGERESGTAWLEQAVWTYRAALEERTRDRVPLDWAITQKNLGGVLVTLGLREQGTLRLEQAIQAYREALQEQTRERVPLDWATTLSDLGDALQYLGRRENRRERVEEAVWAYRQALEEHTRERTPLLWATTQNGLGAALVKLASHGGGTELLGQAIQVYHAALEERTQEHTPLDWAITQYNLGNALVALGKHGDQAARFGQAAKAYRGAAKVFEESGTADYLDMAHRELARTEAWLTSQDTAPGAG